MDDERYATQRGRYLVRTTELREPEAKAIAYTERGYSFAGTAKQLDTTESTVKQYMEKAMARYGLSITETLLPEEEHPDYDPVGPAYYRGLSNRDEQERWEELFLRHKDSFPREWVNQMLDVIDE